MLVGCTSFSARGRPSLHELATTYSATQDGSIKRDVCLRAIDLKYVAVGAPLENVRVLCGTDFTEHVGVNANGDEYGIVDFTAPLAITPVNKQMTLYTAA